MERFIAGDIVAINYPFSDLTSHKSRPALIIAKANENDFIVCQITSQHYEESNAIKIEEQYLVDGKLRKVSYALPSKLFTSDSKLFKYRIAKLSKNKFDIVVSEIISLLKNSFS